MAPPVWQDRAPGPGLRIALIAPRNMRFSPTSATSIDLHIHETALWSRYRDRIVVFAEAIAEPFGDVSARFWPKGRPKGHLERLLAEERPDIIVAHQHLPTAARLARRFPNVPVVLVRHNFQNPPRNYFSAILKRRQFNRLAAIAFVSERCRDDFLQRWSGIRPPVHVTPNGVDARLWQAGCQKEPVILFCGRLAPEKGVLEAALGVEQTLAERPGWRAVFILACSPDNAAYAGEVRHALARIGDRVTVIEDAAHAQVRDWMARSSIALAPTQGEESFGRVAVEAMASGTAVIVSRASGFVEVVGDAGLLLDRPEAGAVHAALLRLIDAPAERARLSGAGRARVEARYDLPRSVVAFDRMVGALLDARGHAAAMDPGAALGYEPDRDDRR